MLKCQHFSWKQHTFWSMQHFNCKVLTRFNWLYVGKSMDEFHPPTCHVIEERHRIFEFWLLFNYIITNGTLTCVTWAFVVHHQTKLFDVCHVYGLKILKLLIYWKCQHMILCHVDIYVTHLHDTWHLVVCRSSNICEVEPK